jgi:hypothetical protein
MRPKSIVNFERVVLLSILIGIVSTWVNWDQMQAAMAQAQQGRAMLGAKFAIGVQAVAIAIYLLLLWLIARKGSPVAKWIYVVFALLGLGAAIVRFRTTVALGTPALLLAIVQFLLTLAALWLIFRPDSKAWFSEGRAPDPDAFQ